jgi:hypothetical protein
MRSVRRNRRSHSSGSQTAPRRSSRCRVSVAVSTGMAVRRTTRRPLASRVSLGKEHDHVRCRCPAREPGSAPSCPRGGLVQIPSRYRRAPVALLLDASHLDTGGIEYEPASMTRLSSVRPSSTSSFGSRSGAQVERATGAGSQFTSLSALATGPDVHIQRPIRVVRQRHTR